jgi:tRNA(Ile2) C34 agmatinyltransferase TiaS
MTPATLAPEPLFRPSALRPAFAPEPGAGERHAGSTQRDDPVTRHNASAKGGGLTIDELLVGVWEGLSAHHTVPCPACGGALAPRYGAGPGPVGGRCRDCGTTIE